jgi:hypothetical protein
MEELHGGKRSKFVLSFTHLRFVLRIAGALIFGLRFRNSARSSANLPTLQCVQGNRRAGCVEDLGRLGLAQLVFRSPFLKLLNHGGRRHPPPTITLGNH